jgi:copper transport protein
VRRRLLLALLALLGSWLVAGVITAGPASAHALLESTSPEDGAQLGTAPAKVTLTFSENVSLRAGYVHVVDGTGTRADAGNASVSGPTVTVPLRPSLPQGGYLVTYRVISADSHPVGGSISFVVGRGSPVAPGTVSSAGATDPVVGAVLPVARWLTFAGLALSLGIPVLLALC